MEKIARLALSKLEDILQIEDPLILGIGAEAILIKGQYVGESVVAKFRYPKSYRFRELDQFLRRSRTATETKIMAKCRLIGVSVPQIVFVSVDNGLLVMEYIGGEKLKTLIEEKKTEVSNFFYEIGRYVGILHENGIVHGDLTTSNVIVRDKKPYLIDFGLSFFSYKLEDQGVDLHLFLRALESTHPSLATMFFEKFLEGYDEVRGKDVSKIVVEKMEDIRRRGRYVKERRKSFWKM